MKQIIITILSICVIASCTSPKKDESAKPLTSGLLLENMDTTVRPGNNFQMYVNGTWIRNTEIPADKSSYGVGRIVTEEAQENVKSIIIESASANKPVGTDEQKVGDLYASFLDTLVRDKTGIAPLASEFAKIDAIKNYDELSKYFGYANIYGYGTPIAGFVIADLKNPNIYALYAWQAGLGLPDRDYYISKTGNFPEIRKAYEEHIAKMFGLAGIKDGAKLSKEVMALETAIANKHLTKEILRDIKLAYNPYPVDSLDNLLTNIDFKGMLSASGIKGVETIIVGQPSFVMAMNTLVPATKLEIWKAYLKWGVINSTAADLTTAMEKQNFNFFGTVLGGRKEQEPIWRRGVELVNTNLGEVVGKVYVSQHFPTEAKERMKGLVGNLIGAYKTSINELDWMGTETKMEALGKLSKFTPKIGYTDKWKDYSAVSIRKDSLFNNIKHSKVAVHNEQLAKIGNPVDKTEWQMNPQEVNAYYNPMANEIVFPAGILQPPYFDMTADDAVNYGAIGAVIGHEIGHGFDDQGSTFNGDGAMKDWWTATDKEEFKKRTSALVAQYNEFKVLKDLNVNGEFTQGENIGDLGGLSIALKAYKMSLNGKEAPVIDGFTGTQRVFLGWAQAWRSKSREQALRLQVGSNPHSPALWRVNGVVRNIPEFYEAFNVKPGDSLYLAPEKRVKIW